MPSWINRTELTGSSVNANGTASHTCTFTAATAGNFLVAVVAGSVTCSTPSGWTLVQSAVNFTGLYVFTKTASSGESSFSTTHNGSNYVISGIVYEYYTGTNVIGSNAMTGMGGGGTASGPQTTGLTGTYSRFAARSWSMSSAISTSTTTWTLPTLEDYDAYVPRASEDGIALTIAYDDGATGSSFNPSSFMSTTNTSGSGEGVSWALNVAAEPTTIPLNWVAGVNG